MKWYVCIFQNGCVDINEYHFLYVGLNKNDDIIKIQCLASWKYMYMYSI